MKESLAVRVIRIEALVRSAASLLDLRVIEARRGTPRLMWVLQKKTPARVMMDALLGEFASRGAAKMQNVSAMKTAPQSGRAASDRLMKKHSGSGSMVAVGTA